MTITALLMIGEEGPELAAQWVAQGRLAAAEDALTLLQTLPGLTQVVIATPTQDLPHRYPHWPGQWDFDTPGPAFHFGQRLAELIARYPADIFLYLGAGSLPLLSRETLAACVAEVTASATPLALTNNRLSSDWLVCNTPAALAAHAHRLPRDNMLGWVLQNEAGLTVRDLPASAATRLDIDTPADLLLLRLHPRTPPALAAYLQAAAPANTAWSRLRPIVFTPGQRLTLIGRVAPAVWQRVNARARLWVRVFSEERGMNASGRQDTGGVRSLIADYLTRLGPAAFFDTLATMTDAVVFDTRVALAHRGVWPSAADRYASDLGWPDHIADPFLRALTEAALIAPMPVVLGGHSVVSGDLYGLLELGEVSPHRA